MCVVVLSQYRMSSEGNLVKAKVENSDSDDHSSSRKGARSSESSDS